jgi:putative transposase
MYVEGHHCLEQLQDLAQAIPQKRIWRRFQAVILAQQGRTAQDIARCLGCSLRAVKNWVAQYNRGGVAALQERPHPGRPPRLAPDHYRRFQQRLNEPPRPEDGVCTLRGRDVQRVLKQEFGVQLGLQAVDDLLRRLNYRSLMPRPQHEQANPEVQGFFKEIVVEHIEAIAAGHPDEEVRLDFEDEARFGQQGTITRVWAPKGSRPRAVRQTRYTFLFVLVAVCVSTGEASALIMPELNAEVVNLFLEEFARELPVGVHAVLIWDGAGDHVSADLRVPSTVSLILLPPYSPELNPVEDLWHFLRAHHWSNRPYRDYKDLENEAVRSMRKVCLDDKENLKNICNAPYVMKRA